MRAPFIQCPHEVIAGGLNARSVFEQDAEHGLLTVVLDRRDACSAVPVTATVKDLESDELLRDDVADRNWTLRRRYKRMIRLARVRLRVRVRISRAHQSAGFGVAVEMALRGAGDAVGEIE